MVFGSPCIEFGIRFVVCSIECVARPHLETLTDFWEERLSHSFSLNLSMFAHYRFCEHSNERTSTVFNIFEFTVCTAPIASFCVRFPPTSRVGTSSVLVRALLIPYLYPYAYEVCSLQLPFKSAEHVHVHLPNELRRRSIPRDSIDSSSHFSLQHSHLNSISSALGGGGGLDGTASSTLAATADDGQASFTRSVEISKPEEATLASASAVSASNPSLVSSSSVASLHPPLPHAGSPAPVRFKVSSPQVSADDSGTMCPVLR